MPFCCVLFPVRAHFFRRFKLSLPEFFTLAIFHAHCDAIILFALDLALEYMNALCVRARPEFIPFYRKYFRCITIYVCMSVYALIYVYDCFVLHIFLRSPFFQLFTSFLHISTCFFFCRTCGVSFCYLIIWGNCDAVTFGVEFQWECDMRLKASQICVSCARLSVCVHRTTNTVLTCAPIPFAEECLFNFDAKFERGKNAVPTRTRCW